MSVVNIPGFLSIEFGEYIRKYFKTNSDLIDPHKHKSNERLHLISSILLYLVPLYFFLTNNPIVSIITLIIAISISGLHMGQMYNTKQIANLFRTIITICIAYLHHKNYKLVIWAIPVIFLSCMHNIGLLTLILYYGCSCFNQSDDLQCKSITLFSIIASITGVLLDKSCNIEYGHELYHIALATMILISNMQNTI